jgi:hypothetical protein
VELDYKISAFEYLHVEVVNSGLCIWDALELDIGEARDMN